MNDEPSTRSYDESIAGSIPDQARYKKNDPLKWQEPYLAELYRTTGKVGSFTSVKGTWWSLILDEHSSPQKYQKTTIIQMTARLKERPTLEKYGAGYMQGRGAA